MEAGFYFLSSQEQVLLLFCSCLFYLSRKKDWEFFFKHLNIFVCVCLNVFVNFQVFIDEKVKNPCFPFFSFQHDKMNLYKAVMKFDATNSIFTLSHRYTAMFMHRGQMRAQDIYQSNPLSFSFYHENEICYMTQANKMRMEFKINERIKFSTLAFLHIHRIKRREK